MKDIDTERDDSWGSMIATDRTPYSRQRPS